MVESSSSGVPPGENAGVRLGTWLGHHAKQGRDKLTIVTTPGIGSFGAWLEQLVAESTGKNGKGIVPVDLERLGAPGVYGKDRVFAYLRLDHDPNPSAVSDLDQKIDALRAAGHPVVTMTLAEPADLVQEMYRWEIATATAGHILGINPFDQPNVQESKDFTSSFLAAFKKDGKLPDVPGEKKLFEGNGIRIYADEANQRALDGKTSSLASVLAAHLGRAVAGDYVAINAYVEMNPANAELIARARHKVRDGKKVATTVGFGPRFLHSTGQIHKGGPASGVFVQITSDDAKDLAIPGEPYSFGVLKTAQANGDFMALSKRGRRLIRIHLGSDVASGLRAIDEAIGK
jgi:transaldolase/glucose-6-phosphate isomerase